MEDLEIDPLSITASTEGQRRVLGKGESLNTTQSVFVTDDNLESVLRMRWPALDHEKAVVERLTGKQYSLREYDRLIDETQTVWSTARPRQLCFQMAGTSGSTGAAKRNTGAALHSVKTVCVNEFWAFAVRKRKPESPFLLAIADTTGDEIVWDDTGLEVANFQVGAAYFDQLFICDDFVLKAVNVLSHAVEVTVPLEPLLSVHIHSAAPPRLTAVRVSESFVVISVQSHSALVFARIPDFPCLGFIAANVSLAVPDHREMLVVALQTGEVEYWHTTETNTLAKLSSEQFFTDDVTTAKKRKISMKPQPVWNAMISGPRVAVTTREYFVMADRNPSTCRIAKLDDAGTLDYFSAFAEFIVTSELAGAVLMHEYASGDVFYRSDEPKRLCEQRATIGSPHLSFAFDRVIDLLPNGHILVITTRGREPVRNAPNPATAALQAALNEK